MRASEHPAAAVRAAILGALRRRFPSRCEADLEDAAHHAIAGLLASPRGPWAIAERPGSAIRLGFAGATRALLGWRREGSARTPATSIASPAMLLARDGGEAEEAVPPAEWVDAALACALRVDLDAALEVAEGATPGEESAAEALALLSSHGYTWIDLAARLGAEPGHVAGWAAGRWRPSTARLAALRAILRAAEAGPLPPLAPAPPAPPRGACEVEPALAAARAAGWTLRDLGAALGAGAATVGRWCAGRGRPSPAQVAALRVLAGAPPA